MAGGLQTTVSYKSPKGIPGMIADMNDCVLVTAVCTTTILPGTYVELTLAADNETLLANTPVSTVGTLGAGGIAVYDPMADPGVLKSIGSTSAPSGKGFPIGMPITVMRRGAAYVLVDSSVTTGSIGFDVQANVNHSSSTTPGTTNGSFSLTTAVTTSGIEVTAAKGASFERMVDTGVALVNINRPAADR